MNDYAALKREINAAGLLHKQPRRYLPKALANAALLGASIAVLVLTDNLWAQLANAALLAFTTVQLCFLGHDAGHRQIFRSSRNNRRAGLVISALVGINRTWWIDKHNRHHGNPNDDDDDPDLRIPLLALSAEQGRRAHGIHRLAARHQKFLFYPLTCLEGLVIKVSGVPTIARGQTENPVAEAAALAIHVAVYAGMVAWCLPPWEALAFAGAHHALTGLYLSATFAPNHKGMPTTDRSSRPDFLRQQVLTSRNVRPGALNDLLYGGLNYQIEHHLCPTMPRHNLGKARPIVREFCRRNAIPYHETTPLGSQREIIHHLANVSAAMRA